MPERTSETPGHPGAPDTRLAQALEPAVEAALIRSIQRHPALWSDAIFPIVLPAIRKAAAAALRTMVQNLNQLLEQSLSARSWRWRWEAARCGKPFAEVVLLRTLIYRVEQVLLMDRNSGLLLVSVSASGVASHDSSVISSMLIALQDFVHDSFQVESNASIRELHVGDFSLWIEQGPYAAIAAAVRGNAPADLRETLRAAVDLVHQELGAELRDFHGDSRPFEERCRDVLEGCLLAQYQTAKKPGAWRTAALIVIVCAAIALWAGIRIRHARQWNRAVTALSQTPGLMILPSSESHGAHVVEGLRDPFAESPERILARYGIDPREVSLRLQPFLSLEPRMVLSHARDSLHAPATVSMALDRDVLIIRGSAPHGWILQARSAGGPLGMAGIHKIRTSELVDSGLESLQTAIESRAIVFPVGSSAIAPDQARAVNAVAAEMRQWIEGAIAIGRVPRVLVVGYADPTGPAARNRDLSEERAAHVGALLSAASVPGAEMSVQGAAPAGRQRKVVFHLTMSDAGEVEKEAR